jgi:hypothetical protein
MGATMNDKPINSLISAYHDGELTAAERGEVEQLLASSPEARAELDAYRRVSNLLREAGRPALQTDLTPLVMQQIKQQMSLPTTESRPTRRANWTRWISIAAVAAGLMVAVKLGWQAPPQADDVAKLHNQNPSVPQIPINTVTPQPQNHDQNNSSLVANNATLKTSNPEVKPAEIQITASDIPLEVIENLKRANPGKIVRFLKQSGKDVAVFHLMVLDTKPGLESLQVILSAQQISGPKGQVGQAGVMAIYVEANQDQMDKVIAALQSEEQKQFIALAVQQLMKSKKSSRISLRN